MQTNPTTGATAAVSVPARELRSRLKAVMPHASTDDQLLVLTCVRFEIRGGYLYLAATDRYTLAVARLRIPGSQDAPQPDQDALLPMPAVKSLRWVLKDAGDKATITIGDGRFTVDNGSGTISSWATHTGVFPEWRPLLHKMLGNGPTELGDQYGIDPRKLGHFASPPSKHSARADLEPLQVRVTGRRAGPDDKPAGFPALLVTRGDWFLGALMPVRRGRDGDTAPPASGAWASWTAATAPASPPGQPTAAEECAA